ncbi:uncharacterized protein LY79DRAFT_542321, partial [Colletotrichum navitas]
MKTTLISSLIIALASVFATASICSDKCNAQCGSVGGFSGSCDPAGNLVSCTCNPGNPP